MTTGAANRLGHDGIGYATFAPREDQPDRGDQQSAFFDSQHAGCSILLGGNGAGTTTLSVAKACRFLLETPPPRLDCPFWFIASNYDQACKVIFKEKIWLGGLIPSDMLEWDRASWYKSKEKLPYTMPLKPHENGNNWQMSFLSYEQNLGSMMASAIGGFMFCEQFPWIILEEVLRGCREYSFTGNKIIEFTPVKPELSVELEEMIQNGPAPEDKNQKDPNARYMPPDWGVYYANTMCAMEAGHVDEEWFNQFFGMIPEDMREVRMSGKFASYEGVIYKGFNPAIHVIPLERMLLRLPECYHRRGIDWGAGPENPFACCWGARNSRGQWFIYHNYESADQEFTTIDHLCEVQREWDWPETDKIFYGGTYADPANPDAIRIAQRLPRYTLDRPDSEDIQPMVIYRGKNAVLEGIEHIMYLLKPQVKIEDPKTGDWKRDKNGKIVLEPKLFISNTCRALIRSLKVYRWKRGADISKGLNPQSPGREPLKLNDHSADSLRYLCFSEDASLGATIGTQKAASEVRDSVMPEGKRDRFAHRGKGGRRR